jgi:hypothetical protein
MLDRSTNDYEERNTHIVFGGQNTSYLADAYVTKQDKTDFTYWYSRFLGPFFYNDTPSIVDASVIVEFREGRLFYVVTFPPNVGKIAIGLDGKQMSQTEADAVITSLREQNIQPQFVGGSELFSDGGYAPRFGGWVTEAQYLTIPNPDAKWSAIGFNLPLAGKIEGSLPLILFDSDSQIIATFPYTTLK